MNNLLFRQYLLDGQIVDAQTIDMAQESYPSLPLDTALARAGAVDENELFEALATCLGVNCVDLTDVIPSVFAVKLILPRVLRKYNIIPLRCTADTLDVATACPGDWEVEEALQFAADRTVVEHLARSSQIRELLNDFLGDRDHSDDLSPDDQSLSRAHENLKERAHPGAHLEFDNMQSRDAAVKIVNRVLKNAIFRGGSDLHVEPHEDHTVIRVRIDGELSVLTELQSTVGAAVVNRLKVLAKMDVAERGKPQDGSCTVQTGTHRLDLRVSSVPTPYGEKIVLRFLDPEQGNVQLEQLGLLPDTQVRVAQLASRPQGLMIVTGPTGSGKSTTLCSIINGIKSDLSNIVSIEDPIEYKIEGVNQIGINPKRGVTFSTVLRSILRQDPNVIYIGEIRDQDTGEIACSAAHTGHMVFSTMHTNDAAAAVTRFLNLGLDRYSVVDALSAVLAQRLVRRVCPACSQPVEPTDDEVRELCRGRPAKTLALRRGTGCTTCGQTGYKGRVAVAELLEIVGDLKELILRAASATELFSAAVELGMRPMWETGLELVARGVTTLEELRRHVPQPEARPDDQIDLFPSSILVVDDDSDVLQVVTGGLRAACRLEDLEIFTAHDGESAFQIATTALPEFVLSDIRMPGLDGFGLCRRLRATEATADMPIIVMTADDTEDAECFSLDHGADDYIAKPIRLRPLISRIRSVFVKRRELSGTPSRH